MNVHNEEHKADALTAGMEEKPRNIRGENERHQDSKCLRKVKMVCTIVW